jgi:hypothetical protein
VNGQWDPQLQMVVNAAIASLLGCTIIALFRHVCERDLRTYFAVFVAIMFALPFAAENTLAGFQSQVYLLIFFSMLTIFGMVAHKPGSRIWMAGVAFSVMSLFCMASGLLAAASVAALMLMRLSRTRENLRGTLLTLFIAASVTLIGFCLNVTVERHQALRARSSTAFLIALGRNLAWPFDHPAWILLTLLPIAVLAVLYYRKRWDNFRLTEFVLAIGGWVIIQAIALAYGRGEFGNNPAGRYMDFLSIGVIANIGAILILLGEIRQPALRVAALAALVLWSGTAMYGCIRLSSFTIRNYLFNKKVSNLVEAENVKAFLATDQDQYIIGRGFLDIPFPSERAAELVTFLRDPTIRSILPAEWCRELEMSPTNNWEGFQKESVIPERPKPLALSVWSSHNSNSGFGFLQSSQITSPLPMISLYVCRFPKSNELSAEIQTPGSRNVSLQTSTNRWENVVQRVPSSPFQIEAKDESKDNWIGITNPKPIGRWSYYLLGFLPYGRLLIALSLILLLIITGASILRLAKVSPAMTVTNVIAALALMICLTFVWKYRHADARTFTANSHAWLGAKRYETRQYGESIAYFLEALWLEPDRPETLRNLTLALIAFKDPHRRSASSAVQYAERACILSKYENIKFMDTLGMAYAEADRFDDAVDVTKKSIALAERSGQQDAARDLREKLDLYSLGLKYRPAPGK